jgi:hypothetical protein
MRTSTKSSVAAVLFVMGAAALVGCSSESEQRVNVGVEPQAIRAKNTGGNLSPCAEGDAPSRAGCGLAVGLEDDPLEGQPANCSVCPSEHNPGRGAATDANDGIHKCVWRYDTGFINDECHPRANNPDEGGGGGGGINTLDMPATEGSGTGNTYYVTDANSAAPINTYCPLKGSWELMNNPTGLTIDAYNVATNNLYVWAEGNSSGIAAGSPAARRTSFAYPQGSWRTTSIGAYCVSN